MTVGELKKILNRIPDNTYIEAVQSVSKGIQHYPIMNLTYDQKWNSWQIHIE